MTDCSSSRPCTIHPPTLLAALDGCGEGSFKKKLECGEYDGGGRGSEVKSSFVHVKYGNGI